MEICSIPQPKKYPVLKNILSMDLESPIQGLMKLAEIHGPIFRLSLPSRELLVVSSNELVSELCDEKRFDKRIHPTLNNIRDFAGDGLFTAATQEPNWQLAHKLLVPAFGPASLRQMFEGMKDIAEQLLVKWERLGENNVIDVPDNMTRLTLDTIALCAFDYRFNSFYQKDMHPFVDAMVRGLKEAGDRANRLPLQTKLMLQTHRQYSDDAKYMGDIADELIRERKKDPLGTQKKDLLGLMLSAKDPETGEGLSDLNIRYQMVTFLIAGHETTSGLLSFALYLMLKDQTVLKRAKAEVDAVLQGKSPRFEHLAQLKYIDQILKEALRLWPTAPAFALYPYQDTVLAGKYEIKKDETALVLVPTLHRDKAVWGPTADAFNPDRFAPEVADSIPEHAWKPFGTGQRACIGRPFAMQESVLLLSMMLQRFDLSMDDPNYILKVKETLTLKPDGFFIRAKKRAETKTLKSGQNFERPLDGYLSKSSFVDGTNTLPMSTVGTWPTVTTHDIPLLILYGSNSGSSQAFAQKIANDSILQGYKTEMTTLDSHTGKLPKEGAVVIVTASYEGKPPENAKKFVSWLETTSENLSGVKFLVLGCGHKDWSKTYQFVPKYIDSRLEELGAERLLNRGAADARGDFFGDFDTWYSPVWSTLATKFSLTPHRSKPQSMYDVEILPNDTSAEQDEFKTGFVLENRELVNRELAISISESLGSVEPTTPLARSKRHIEIELPPGVTYQAGDYAVIVPKNPMLVIERVAKRFFISTKDRILIRKNVAVKTFLPVDQAITVEELFGSYLELTQPATRKQIQKLADLTRCPPEKQPLLAMIQDDESYNRLVFEKRVSVLDLLERFAACEITLGDFIEMLPPLKTRQYSISSSPLWSENKCTLTVAVVDAPAWSGQGRFQGVASTFLANAEVGSRIAISTRAPSVPFRLPTGDKPIILVAAGTGLAPFRGFIQERAIRISRGENLGRGILFFGCDHPEIDFIYEKELREWESLGAIELRPTFSKLPTQQQESEPTFVQHRIWNERAEIMQLINQGAHVYVCGDGLRMAPAVRETFLKIQQELQTQDRVSFEDKDWIAELERQNRYVADVFG